MYSLATATILADEHAAQLLAAVQASKQHATVVAAVVPRLLVVDASSEHDGEKQQLPSDGARMLSTGAGGALDLPVGSNFVRMTPSILEGLLIGAFMLWVLWIAIGCILTVKTPSAYVHKPLPPGKEF